LEYQCRFYAEEGEDFCIFHLPVEKKDPAKFWKHLASYIKAQLEKAGTEDTKKWAEANPDHWVFKEADPKLVQKYEQQIAPESKWDFAYFIFPEMDENHSFAMFTFPDVNFSGAQFKDLAGFLFARFQGAAGFLFAQFQGDASFLFAQFQGGTNFLSARFQGVADFRSARFQGAVEFEFARFQAAADFSFAQFQAPTYFIRAKIESLMNFSSIKVRNRLLFAGTDFGPNARILLWNIDFVYGKSDIKMENGYTKGQIIEPAGQVVFQDIPKGINQVSFLHTEILTDRLCVRFSNVKWEKDAKKFIFDANFAFIEDWNRETLQESTGLPENVIDTLPQIFFVATAGLKKMALSTSQAELNPEIFFVATAGLKKMALPISQAELNPEIFFVATPELKTDAEKEENIKRCEPLIKEDVERIAREIRLSYEKYGNYPEAGDYYIAEMDYKRAKTSKKPVRPFLFWLALSLYKWVSNYGESPSRALGWILGLWLLPLLIIGLRNRLHLTDGNLCGYVLANMIALQAPSPELLQAFDSLPFWMVHKIFGISVITLFLLAVRRRFRR